MSGERLTGYVKFFDQKKGWGFIRRDGEDDVFMHGNDVVDMVDDGNKVSFVMIEGKKGKGPKAGDVRLVP